MSKRKTVMICDDEADLLYLFRAALEPIYDVLTAQSGKNCIDKFIEEKEKGNKIDILLIDYKLGDMQGDIVACEIHQLNGVKTFLISAFELEYAIINQLMERKCIVGSMKKPVRMSSLIKELEQI